MSFTTKELVKKHILEHHIGSKIIYDEAVQLLANDISNLQNCVILASTESIKAKEQNEPTLENISFADGDSIILSHPKLIPDSVVVSNDSSLGRIYIENVDYGIDYSTGQIRRIASGSIPAGGNVVIWFLYYRIYQRGIDYDIDYQRGTLRRRTSGDIESGQWVLVDYTTEYGNIDDEAIENAIVEANQQLVTFIDDVYRDSSDRSLVTAETYLAISIVCRIRAMESISPSRGADTKSSDAMSWRALSDMYRREAYDILARFAGVLGSFKSPSKA